MGERALILAVLQNLASNPATQAVVAQDGGLAVLVASLKSVDDAEKTVAVDALIKMLENPNVQAAIGLGGAIPALVALVRDGSPSQREKAVGALAKLSESTANQMLIAECGGVAALVSRAQDLIADGSAVAAGTKQEVSKTMSSCESASYDTLKSLVAEFLSDLCDGQSISTSLYAECGVQLALVLLKNGDEDQQKIAIDALAGIGDDKSAATHIVEWDVIPILVKVLRDGSDSLKWSVAEVLRAITSHDDIARNPVAKSGVIPALTAMVEAGDDDQVRNVLCTLRNLSYEEETPAEFAQSSGIPVLLTATRHSDSIARALAVDTLSILVEDPTCSAVMVREGAIKILLTLLREGTVDGYILSVLVIKHAAVSGVQEAERVDALVALVQFGRGSEILRATEALDTLTTSPTACERLVVAGGAPLLTALTRNGNAREKRAAEAVLGKLPSDCSANEEPPPAKRAKTESKRK